MNKVKKILTIAVICVLIATIFVGCRGKTKEEPTENTTVESTTEEVVTLTAPETFNSNGEDTSDKTVPEDLEKATGSKNETFVVVSGYGLD